MTYKLILIDKYNIIYIVNTIWYFCSNIFQSRSLWSDYFMLRKITYEIQNKTLLHKKIVGKLGFVETKGHSERRTFPWNYILYNTRMILCLDNHYRARQSTQRPYQNMHITNHSTISSRQIDNLLPSMLPLLIIFYAKIDQLF